MNVNYVSKLLINISLISYRKCLQQKFEDNIETLDFFGDSEGSRTKINDFISNVTEGHVKDVLIPGSISQETKLVLANAAFFKGQWGSKFDPEKTSMKIFYDFGKIPVYVEMMEQQGYFNFGKLSTSMERSEHVPLTFLSINFRRH